MRGRDFNIQLEDHILRFACGLAFAAGQELAEAERKMEIAQADRDAALDTLARLEWSAGEYGGFCPSCKRYQEEGHKNACELAESLGA